MNGYAPARMQPAGYQPAPPPPSGPLLYASEIDPRVKYTPALAGVWSRELQDWSEANIRWAIDHYATSPLYHADNGWHEPLTIARLLKILRSRKATAEARHAARTAVHAHRMLGPSRPPLRTRDREAWDALVARGVAEGIAERVAAGTADEVDLERLRTYQQTGRMPDRPQEGA